jgi:hypothetical protein
MVGEIFGTGARLEEPRGDEARQAVAALRGYTYQLHAAALAWLGLQDGEFLHLEVAEDYAVASREALSGTQVRDTAASGRLTLHSAYVRQTIDSFVDLRARNPGRRLSLHYLTTSELGQERGGEIEGGALQSWRRAASGGDVTLLRRAILQLDLAVETKEWLEGLSEQAFRSEFLAQIHWQCGAPPLAGLRDDLESGLVEFVASTRRLPGQVGRDVAPAVVEKVLMTSVSEDRRLRRADLLDLVDRAAMVTVPLRHVLPDPQAMQFARQALLVPLVDMPFPQLVAPRSALVATIGDSLAASGVALLWGGTGLGKSLVARLAATATGEDWAIVDFRDLGPAESAARLELVLGEVSVGSKRSLIVDDLNEQDHPTVRSRLSRLVAAQRRRDARVIVTHYLRATPALVHALGADATASIEVPYFNELEVTDLLRLVGGTPAHVAPVLRATAEGHPQLTVAMLLQLSREGWPVLDDEQVLDRGPTDLELERRVARRMLLRNTDETMRTLLFRTTLVRGAFDRETALGLGSIYPVVATPGLVLDRLVGPWIEQAHGQRLRVSPLLQNAAEEVLSSDQCRTIHLTIARNLLERETLSVLDAGTLLHHALRSRDGRTVSGLAVTLIGAGTEALDVLAPYLAELASLSTTEPILPAAASASAQLRLGQLLFALASGDVTLGVRCRQALERETATATMGSSFELLTLSKVLLSSNAGVFFPDWLAMLARADELIQAHPSLSALQMRGPDVTPGPHGTGVFLATQLQSIETVRAFKALMEGLDTYSAEFRERALSSFRTGHGDLGILVNHGWLRESRKPGFDWEQAGADYDYCSQIAARWGNQTLAVRCVIAQSICYDESGGDPDRALQCLVDAETRLGFDIALVRARAKVHWGRREHSTALPLLAEAARVGGQDPVEQAFIAREAGISAAALGRWVDARGWFNRASQIIWGSPTRVTRAMAIGLKADAAHAAFQAGDPRGALEGFREAVLALPTIDPDGELSEAYCHRVVRHAVLWLVEALLPPGDGDMGWNYQAGMCSNPEPLEIIRTHPLGHIDVALYLLARADWALAEPTGFHRSFRDLLTEGPILTQEVSLAIFEDRQALEHHDPWDFSERVIRHAAVKRLLQGGLQPDESLIAPRRGSIPDEPLDRSASEDLLDSGADYVLSFAIATTLAELEQPLDEVREAGLTDPRLSGLRDVFDRLGNPSGPANSQNEGVASTVSTLRNGPLSNPAEAWYAGAWLLIHLGSSQFCAYLEPAVVAWIFATWSRFTAESRFRLILPSVNCDPVERQLATSERGIQSAATLLLAAAPAAMPSVHGAVRARIVEMANLA